MVLDHQLETYQLVLTESTFLTINSLNLQSELVKTIPNIHRNRYNHLSGM